jgi:hypothetical protein
MIFMNFYISIFFTLFSLNLFGQSCNFNHEFLCFEPNFIDSIQPNDTLKATITKKGCSPLEFKQTGEFYRVKGYPNFICGKGVRLRMIPKIDKLKGTWSFNDNVLIMKTKKKTIELQLIEQTKYNISLQVLGTSSNH